MVVFMESVNEEPCVGKLLRLPVPTIPAETLCLACTSTSLLITESITPWWDISLSELTAEVKDHC
jgi:hypothetical protein